MHTITQSSLLFLWAHTLNLVIAEESGDVRLVGGARRCTGVVEMIHQGQWGPEWRPVGYNSFLDHQVSPVVCRQLGCGSEVSTQWREGSTSQPVWGFYPSCHGSESVLMKCSGTVWSRTSSYSLELICSGSNSCGQPPYLEDGDLRVLSKTQYSNGERVDYVCQSLYIMEGGPHRTCLNGQWVGNVKCLKPCTVTDEDMRVRNIQFRHSNEKKLYLVHNTELEFMCASRGQTNNINLRQRCTDGEITLPSCQ